VWFVVALCILIALTALIACIPVDLGLRVEAHGKPSVGFTLGWLFGRVKKTFRSGEDGEKPARAAEEEKKEAKKKEEKKRDKRRGPDRDSASLVWRILHVRGLARSVSLLFNRILKCFRLRNLFAGFDVSLEDPADTALVVGTASQAAMFADIFSRYDFRVTPVFENDWYIAGEGGFDVRVYPIQLVPPVFAFLFSPSTLRVAGMLIAWKTRRK
jgi:hypothetical protein